MRTTMTHPDADMLMSLRKDGKRILCEICAEEYPEIREEGDIDVKTWGTFTKYRYFRTHFLRGHGTFCSCGKTFLFVDFQSDSDPTGQDAAMTALDNHRESVGHALRVHSK